MSSLNALESPVSWDDEGGPCSPVFDDIYHSSSGAVQQADHVFLRGCGLPQGWQHHESFIILETGFGLGLNFLTAWLRWQQDPLRCKHLHFVSVEAYPVKVEDIANALEMFPELLDVGRELLNAYPRLMSMGTSNATVREVTFFEKTGAQIKLTLVLGDARVVLQPLTMKADAIFLDGFSPSKNPELWGADICQQLARLARSGARIASWCVAAQVRQHLSDAGFHVQRVAGLPPKRHALAGEYKELK